jgi:hypothetical protein
VQAERDKIAFGDRGYEYLEMVKTGKPLLSDLGSAK